MCLLLRLNLLLIRICNIPGCLFIPHILLAIGCSNPFSSVSFLLGFDFFAFFFFF